MRFTDLMMAFPALLLAIVLAAIFQPSLWIVALVIALVNWVQMARVDLHRDALAGRARVHRGRARARRRPAAHPRSATSCRTWCRPCIVWGTLGIATTVLLEATLSASSASACSRRRRPGATSSSRTRPTSRPRPGWCSSPAPRSSLLALAFNLVGDALRDMLDPTQKGRD